MLNNVHDIRLKNPTLGIDDLLSSYGIELVGLRVPTNPLEPSRRKIGGRIGTARGVVEINDLEISLVVQIKGYDKLDLLNKEDRLRYLLSQPHEMTLTQLHSYDPMYKFMKIGDIPNGYKQLYERFSVDVIPTGIIEPSYSGTTGRYTITFDSVREPYRYISEKHIDLSKPTRTNTGQNIYEFTNNGNVVQNSREFGLYVEVSNTNTKNLRIEFKDIDDDDRSNSGLYYTGSLLTRNTVTFNGYMLKVDGMNDIKKSNYGVLHLPVGQSKLIITTDRTSNLTGEVVFKEFIH